MMNDNDFMQKKLEVFKDQLTPIHINCFNGRFFNGRVIEINTKKQFIVLKDNKLGDVPILFEEIRRMEPFMEDNK